MGFVQKMKPEKIRGCTVLLQVILKMYLLIYSAKMLYYSIIDYRRTEFRKLLVVLYDRDKTYLCLCTTGCVSGCDW